MVDNFDEIDRLAALVAEGALADRAGGQSVLVRVTPDVRGETHEKISTGQADSKFGFAMAQADEAIARLQAVDGLSLEGLHAHIGSQLLGLEPFRREAAELAKLGEFPVWDLGGGLGVQYTEEQPSPPSIEEYVGALVRAAHAHGMGAERRLLIEPGRVAVRERVRDAVHGRERQAERLALGGRRRRHVRQHAPDALWRNLRGSRGRPLRAARPQCVLAGKHCESGDVIAAGGAAG